MRRRLLDLLTVLSLLLCVAAAVLRGRGHRTIDAAAYRGERLSQFVVGDGRLYVQRVRFATRAGEGAPAPARAGRRPGVPVRPIPLTRFVETQGNYLDWAAQRDGVPQVPRLGRWEEEPSPGWRWTSTPANDTARPGAGGRVRDWLVDGPSIHAPAAGWAGSVPGAGRLAFKVRIRESVRFDPETGVARPWVEEQWLTGWTAWAPLSLIAAAAAALPAARFVAWRVRRRRERRLRRAHQCSACGYDLTGNVSGKCPECGRPI